MADSATLKDVLYALQFLGETVMRTEPVPPARKPTYSLSGSSRKVDRSTIDKLRRQSGIVEDERGIRWKAAA